MALHLSINVFLSLWILYALATCQKNDDGTMCDERGDGDDTFGFRNYYQLYATLPFLILGMYLITFLLYIPLLCIIL